MLIPVFRLAAMSAETSEAQRAMVDADDDAAIARAVDAVEIHFLDEEKNNLGDDRATIDVCAIRFVAVMFHAVTGGLHPDLGFDVVVERAEGFEEDSDDDIATADDEVDEALAVADAIAAAVVAALAFKRSRLSLSTKHLS